MKTAYWLFLFALMISCDDPSLDNNIDDNDPVEPVFETTQLASITVAENTATNIIRTIDFNYDVDDLLEQVIDNIAGMQVSNFEYSNANRLETIEQSLNATPPQLITVTTGTGTQDFISLQYTNTTGNLIEERFFTDQQNRIDQIIVLVTVASGVTTQESDRVFNYSQNFNVNRINTLNDTGLTIGFSDFTYNFNNNPFKDMNDVIRSFLFDEFNPYSRNLPATREDYTVSNSGVTLVKSITYDYTLNADGFPTQRELQVTENGITTTYFEIFNYRP